MKYGFIYIAKYIALYLMAPNLPAIAFFFGERYNVGLLVIGLAIFIPNNVIFYIFFLTAKRRCISVS